VPPYGDIGAGIRKILGERTPRVNESPQVLERVDSAVQPGGSSYPPRYLRPKAPSKRLLCTPARSATSQARSGRVPSFQDLGPPKPKAHLPHYSITTKPGPCRYVPRRTPSTTFPGVSKVTSSRRGVSDFLQKSRTPTKFGIPV